MKERTRALEQGALEVYIRSLATHLLVSNARLRIATFFSATASASLCLPPGCISLAAVSWNLTSWSHARVSLGRAAGEESTGAAIVPSPSICGLTICHANRICLCNGIGDKH